LKFTAFVLDIKWVSSIMVNLEISKYKRSWRLSEKFYECCKIYN